MKTQIINLPAFFASALINDDYSGLEDGDIKMVQDFINDNPKLNCVDVAEDSFFGLYNGIGCELSEFYFYSI